MRTETLREANSISWTIKDIESALKELNDKEAIPVMRIKRALDQLSGGVVPGSDYDKYLTRVCKNIQKKLEGKKSDLERRLSKL